MSTKAQTKARAILATLFVLLAAVATSGCLGGSDEELPDRDGDSYPDKADAFPDDATEWFDSDGDGVGNNTDAFPEDPNEWLDTDGDGIGNNADLDDDNDLYSDAIEITEGSDPLDSLSIPADNDSDLIPDSTDEDDDNDGYNDTIEISEGTDQYDNSSIPADNDSDFLPDSIDPDDDNDGYNDTGDDFPFDSAEWLDTDDDGIGNNADQDDDNDGYNDTVENAEDTDPLNATSTPPDNDLDYLPDSTDPDDDNDGYLDEDDVFPFDPTEWADFDEDGIGDNADLDDDNDTVSDLDEIGYGSDPKNATDVTTVMGIILDESFGGRGESNAVHLLVNKNGVLSESINVEIQSSNTGNGTFKVVTSLSGEHYIHDYQFENTTSLTGSLSDSIFHNIEVSVNAVAYFMDNYTYGLGVTDTEEFAFIYPGELPLIFNCLDTL